MPFEVLSTPFQKPFKGLARPCACFGRLMGLSESDLDDSKGDRNYRRFLAGPVKGSIRLSQRFCKELQ